MKVISKPEDVINSTNIKPGSVIYASGNAAPAQELLLQLARDLTIKDIDLRLGQCRPGAGTASSACPGSDNKRYRPVQYFAFGRAFETSLFRRALSVIDASGHFQQSPDPSGG